MAIWNALWPDEPASVEGIRYKESIREKKYFFSRVMVELGGGIVAMAIYREPFWSLSTFGKAL